MEGTIAVTRGASVTVHTYTAPEAGWKATSHIIELPSQLILVDTPLLPAHASEVVNLAASLGKPISRVYVSHAHPDHYAGTGLVEAPGYALAPVMSAVNERGAAVLKGAYALTGHHDVDPVKPPAIDHAVTAGDEVIDGVRFSFEPVRNAESADQLTIALPGDSILIAQDVLYNHVHAFVAEQSFDGWADAITALEARPYDTILPGHGQPGDRRLYAATRAYLTAARTAIAAASGPADLTRRLADAYPGYGGLEMQPVQNYYLYPAKP